MNEEQQLTEAQSLELITQMINKAKCDYEETGIGALLWGSLVAFCAIITFFNSHWRIRVLEYIWFLTLFALIPQIIISVRAAKKKRYRTYDDDAMGGIWISFGVALFLMSIYTSIYQEPHSGALFLLMYGIPTFATGYINHFKPMIVGGVICWLFAALSFFIQPTQYIMLLTAAAALSAWFIPGLILRRRYKKAIQENV